MARRELEDWQVKDAQRLRALFDAKTELSQEAFGLEFGLGTQGNVWQYLSGSIPLNLKAALNFARGLNVQLAQISPTLAAQLPAPATRAQIPEAADDPNSALRYALVARFPDLEPDDIALIVGYAEGIAAMKRMKANR